MDLNTVTELVRPARREEIPAFAAGDALLAGGTWLFSEPQEGLRRLVDLTTLNWPDVERVAEGLLLGATCTLAALEGFACPAEWRAAPLIRQCCRALLGSFKIRRFATVGGNLCLALPASPMAALAVALHGVCTVWTADGAREVAAADLIVGDGRTVLRDGDVLRSIVLSGAVLRRRAAFRQMSLTPLGRSAALLIGTRVGDGMELTITASVAHPVRLAFGDVPTEGALRDAVDVAVPDWFGDVHGEPAWRRRITQLMAAEIRAELLAA